MNIFFESVVLILAGCIIFGDKQSAITLIALIASFITVYWTNKHLFARDFSRICSLMRRICSLMRRAISNNKKTEEQEQERLVKAHTKIIDFFTNKLEGETKKSDDKEKAIHLDDDNIFHLNNYNIFEKYGGKEKEIYLVEYSFRWYLGLRAKGIFEEEMDQDFLNNIWNCYGVFSANKLSSMLYIESRSMLCNIERYFSREDSFTQNFYSYRNKEIEIYLPTNVVLKISDNGLYEIVRVGAYD